ncbi:hydrolase [Tamlana sp. s12]|uniref:Hydrolase n=1 Tax=Pseudotamlana carrageenivorans TaxID=2069432 RepID=A0A2I7SLA4_9FLAO|nr:MULTISPECIES: hydrolase [Tamlana]AUS06672.1 hydrolase [Tamlana carrageenivorans]OBQ54124.1 hydrolase [Tamlana sp. s12]QQY81364.1 hydrolase [Tamlana sp. s12]
MKQKIFMYLFIFTSLLVLFQYVNAKNIFKDIDKKLVTSRTELKKYKDSVAVLQNDIMEASHFNLDKNEDAITYFENEGYKVDELIPFIKDELYKLNEVRGEHPLIPYASSEGRKLMLNTIKLLNHKWIIADFSDGEFWGELFLTYEITEDKELKFNLVEHFLYPLN